MSKPLVTVICICYNHAQYVYDALCSVKQQTYSYMQLIIADDASNDESKKEIERFVMAFPEMNAITIFNERNTGNCTLFNKALALAEGKYIIDLSADDYLYVDCIEKQVELFEVLSEKVGVVFSNVDMVNPEGEFLKSQYSTDKRGKSLEHVQEGDVFVELLKRYYVSPVGMMMRKSVLDELEGYDQLLAYEDFDFWIRSSRNYHYKYLDERLVAKRILPKSHSTKFLAKGNERMFVSTARVCQKASCLVNKDNKKEVAALRTRLRYEIRQSIKYQVKNAFEIYLDLLKQNGVWVIEQYLYLVFFKLYKRL